LRSDTPRLSKISRFAGTCLIRFAASTYAGIVLRCFASALNAAANERDAEVERATISPKKRLSGFVAFRTIDDFNVA
jgi:hypothetical protein